MNLKFKILVALILAILLGSNGYFWMQQKKLDSENKELKANIAELQKKQVEAQNLVRQPNGSSVLNSVSNQPATSLRFSTDIISKDGNDFKIIKLANKEIYYGIVQSYSNGVVTLVDIFYIQGFADFTNQTTGTQNQISLIKKGNEMDGAVDKMSINDASIISVETLSADSQVFKAISAYMDNRTIK